MDEAPARVLIVEDHPIFREGLAQLINRQSGLTVCGEADDPRSAVSAVEQQQPDVVVLDLMLNGAGGIQLIKQLKALSSKVRILVLSMHDESAFAERALRAGASGYLMKQEASGAVISAIRTILSGELHMSRKVSIWLMHKALSTPEITPDEEVSKLSDRELHVFELIGAGVPTREIATRLGLSVKTVDTHRENIKRKLELNNGAELVNRAQSWVRSG